MSYTLILTAYSEGDAGRVPAIATIGGFTTREAAEKTGREWVAVQLTRAVWLVTDPYTKEPKVTYGSG